VTPTVPDLAPSSIAGHKLTFTDPDQSSVTTTYSFDSINFSTQSGDSGSYSYSKVAGTTTKSNLQLVSVFTSTKTYQLTFTTSTGGTYVDQSNKTANFTYQ
jgi:hypothetical protein